MTDPELRAQLHYLGIDPRCADVLALVPLVEVAWCDGDVDAGERRVIERIVDEQHHGNACARRLVEDWLQFRPGEDTLLRARQLLVALAGHDPLLPVARLDAITEQALEVARAAGGWFGWGAVGPEERAVLTTLAADFERVGGTHHDFDDLDLDDLEEDPTDVVPRSAYGEAAEISFHGDPEPSDGPALVYHHPDGDRRYAVAADGLTVGRARDNTVQINLDGQVSRYHCRIVRHDTGWLLQDRSTNGTWVNGQRVTERQLFGGEEIKVASARFAFQLAR